MKKTSKWASRIMVVLFLFSLAIVASAEGNIGDESFAFEFNTNRGVAWTSGRNKTDDTSLYAKVTNLGGAYYVKCYGAGSNHNYSSGSGSALPNYLHNATHGNANCYVTITSTGRDNYIPSFVYEDGYNYAYLVGQSVASYHNVTGVWSPDSV